jgi:phosphoribosyl 1,2-cyclic phosphodiesterase
MATLGDHQDSFHRTYNRSWDEIESMLIKAEAKMNQWILFYHHSKKNKDKDGMREAARNKKALEGVVKTLKWTLGEMGIDTPLE